MHAEGRFSLRFRKSSPMLELWRITSLSYLLQSRKGWVVLSGSYDAAYP